MTDYEESTTPQGVDEKGRKIYNVESGELSSPDGLFAESDLEPGVLGYLRRLEARMDRAVGLESHAIDRKTDADKRPVKWHEELTMALLWASGTMGLSCFATGFLGWEFGLSLKQSILICIFGSVLGAMVSASCATFSAATGLRQISVSRYSFGWYPNKLIAFLNAVVQLGWAAVGCISGGIALTAVADGAMSLVVGIIIIAVVSLIISLAGLRYILIYERYAWFVFFVIFLIIFGMSGTYADNTTPAAEVGIELSATVLSLLAIIYGSSSSWCTMVGDYYVHYPTNTSRLKIFLLTTVGISIPTSIGMVAGCVVASALNNKPDWANAYNNEGVGYLVLQVIHPVGFAKFILVIFSFSGINTNTISIYSSAISFQQMARPLAKIPRFIWTLLCFAVIMALSLGGRQKLNTYLQDFLGLLGYWSTSYFVIVMLEHSLFRRGKFTNYDLDAWNDPSRLPLGIAATASFLTTVIAWAVGMDQTWFVGPVAKAIGGGADIANEMTLVIGALVYIPVRYLEKKFVGR